MRNTDTDTDTDTNTNIEMTTTVEVAGEVASTADGEVAQRVATGADRFTSPLLIAAAVGAALSIALGVYGNVHTPTGDVVTTFGFAEVLPMKAWLTTGAVVLVVMQIASAMWMWGRLPGVSRAAPTWAATGHRWFGTAAFLLTLPVAYHCLWGFGFATTSPRVIIHSLLGCAFFGAFTTKMLVLRSDRVSPRTLPIVGGLLATTLVAIWWTSSFWFFTTVGFPT